MRTPITNAELAALPVDEDGLIRVDIEIPADSTLNTEDDDFMDMLSGHISGNGKYLEVIAYTVKESGTENVTVSALVEVTHLSTFAEAPIAESGARPTEDVNCFLVEVISKNFSL